MPSVLAGITMPQIILIINLLGLPGLVVIFWYVGHQRQASLLEKMDDQREAHKDQVSEILKEYKADVNKVSVFYERNVELVERYEKHSDHLSGVIHLNTQVMTQLVESIKHNMFCPIVRERGPEGK